MESRERTIDGAERRSELKDGGYNLPERLRTTTRTLATWFTESRIGFTRQGRAPGAGIRMSDVVSRPDKITSKTLWIAIVVILCGLAAATRIVFSHYRAVMREFETWPAAEALSHPEQTGITDLTAVRFTSKDAISIAGWYVPSRNRAAVILTHGTSADRSHLLPEMTALANAGFGVLAFDWPGNGQSSGEIHWNHIERNALTAAADWLVARSDVDPQRVGVLGFSFGGYVTAQVVPSDTRFAAVVLEATPPSMDAYMDHAHDKWGPLSRWPATVALRRAGVPENDIVPEEIIANVAPRAMLFIGGDLDTIVPQEMVADLYEAARPPKDIWIIPGAHHGDYTKVAGAQYSGRLVRFYSEHLLN
jgi:uncharacterized protein